MKVVSDIEKFDDSKRQLARIMARENIVVLFLDSATTASFNVVSRVLVLPNWPSLTMDQLDTLTAHEIGHARWTDYSYLETFEKRLAKKQFSGSGALMTYFNVVEDARIEAKLRAAYPGMKGIFWQGYQDFTTRGPIFRLTDTKHLLDSNGADQPIALLPFIDRINLFYKIGAFADVPFTEAEWKWIERIDTRCFSCEDAMKIAEDLFESERARVNQPPPPKTDTTVRKPLVSASADPLDGFEADPNTESDEESDSTESDEESDSTESDEESDSSENAPGNGDGTPSTDPSAGTKVPEAAQTDEAAKKGLESLAKSVDPRQQILHVLLEPMSSDNLKTHITPVEEWVTRVETFLSGLNALDKWQAALTALEVVWNKKYMATARHMALEFQRRKAAEKTRYAKPGPTGRLNLNKVYAYKWSEDLFNQVTIEYAGQSHGICMIIDASGSMSGVYGNVIDQVLLFAHFAFQCRIPFEAYLFTDCLNGSDKNAYIHPKRPHVLGLGNGRLVGLVNTTTRQRVFKQQVRALLALRYHYAADDLPLAVGVKLRTGQTQNSWGSRNHQNQMPYAELGSTPLYTGVMLLERQVERMKRIHKLDKMVAVVISDGGDTNGLTYTTKDVVSYRVVDSVKPFGGQAFVVRDALTKKNHSFIDLTTGVPRAPQNAVMTLFFDLMKSRHGARGIYMHLTHEQGGACETYLRRAQSPQAVTPAELNSRLKKVRQFVLPNGAADCSMGIVTDALELKEDEFSKVDQTKLKSAEDVGKAFQSALKTARANRVFVNSIMPFII